MLAAKRAPPAHSSTNQALTSLRFCDDQSIAGDRRCGRNHKGAAGTIKWRPVTSDEPAGVGLRYLGGPTALLEVGGLRLLTDPTFDPPGDYPVGSRSLRKTIGAVVSPQDAGQVDAVLLSQAGRTPADLTGRRNLWFSAAPEPSPCTEP